MAHISLAFQITALDLFGISPSLINIQYMISNANYLECNIQQQTAQVQLCFKTNMFENVLNINNRIILDGS